MILSKINFPNELLEDIQNDSLVVFAGAGASMDAPTSLPDFKKLTQSIAEGTGQTLSKNESCEVFLGHLKSTGIDVNQLAANLLSSQCLQHNEMHEAIIDLFLDPSKVKVVTTNYDQMLEQVVEERKQQVQVFNAPALPLGDDVSGIIHIHGNINNPKYMVVTDEDFGKAYLTEGHASRFLIKLFQSYSVLFIGYSYSDTILRYLTRAMARNVGAPRYILTEDRDADWEALGIIPIYFPEKDFAALKEGINKLGQRTKRGLIEWKSQFEEIGIHPSLDPDLETEIDYCLTSLEKSRILANCIKGEDWLDILDKKAVLKNLFSFTAELSELDQVWKEWLLNQIIGKYDMAFEKLILQKKNQVHPEFAKAVLRKLVVDSSEVSDDFLQRYIILFEAYIDSSWLISGLIEVCSKRGLYNICRRVFAKYFTVSFVLKKNYWPQGNGCIYKHRFVGEHYFIHHSWKLCQENFLQECPDFWLCLAKDTICELHDNYLLLGQDVNGDDPYEMTMLVIEDRDEDSRENELNLLCGIFVQSCQALEERNTDYVREILSICLEEPSALLKKVALKSLRELKTVSANDKFDLFIKRVGIYFWGGKEQIFLLIKQIFNDLTDERKDLLIDMIEAENEKIDENHDEYETYNWCVWIKRFCKDNVRINQLEESILSRHEYVSREHPELDIVTSSGVWIPDESPIEPSEMLLLNKQELLSYLRDYNEDSFFKGPSRLGMLKTFAECCKSNYPWAFEAAKLLIENGVQREDVWNRLIQAIQDGEAGADERIDLLKLMSDHLSVCTDVNSQASFLWNILRREDIKGVFCERESQLLEIANTLWNSRGGCDVHMDKLVDASLNTALGNILISYIYMLSYCGEKGIPDRYKKFFEENLKLEGYEKQLVLCVIGGYFNFLCLRDHDWCMDQFSTILEGNEQESFSAAWEGVVFFSNRLNKDVADVIAPIYLKALEHIEWLSGDTRKHFIDLYLVLLIYAVENPCQEYIPVFYNFATDEDRKEFVSCIEHRLRNADSAFIIEWWNRWLHQYLINRFQSKPISLTESEYTIIMNWVPELSETFEDLVGLLCDHNVPQQVDTMFLYQLNDKKMVERYPHEVIRLLTVLLEGGTNFQYYTGGLSEMYHSATGLDDQEKRNFLEACLKRNIKI